MTYFCKEVFADIRQAIPDIRLWIVGSNPGEQVRKLASDSVIVAGFAEDLREHYERARIFVTPVRFGAGINLKVIDAMSHGIPSVVSEFVASGLGIQDGVEALVARTPGDFVERIVRLYSDANLWARLSKASLAFIEHNYTPGVMTEKLARILALDPGEL
jgi:glycosyltransferase involved in cell wall biosynthesis